MNRLRLLPLITLFALLACTVPVQEQTAIPVVESPTVYLPRVTTSTGETETPEPTATLIPETAVPQSTDTPVQSTATPEPTESPIPDTPTSEPTLEPTPEPTVEPTTPPSAAGFACFGTEDGGLVCTSADGDWITPPENGIIRAITACSEQIAIVGNELLLFDGMNFTSQTTPFAPTHVSCADDALWIASDDALAVYVDGDWTTHAGAPTTPIRSLAAVDAETAWTASALTVDRLEDGAWTQYTDQDGFDDTYLFEEVVTAGDGNVWAVATNAILRFSGRRWINPFNEPWPPLSTVAFDFSAPTIGTLYEGVLGNDSAPDNHITALAYDEDGRLYIGTPIGVTIDDSIMYRPATSPLTHPHITQIAIVGSPALPEINVSPNGAVIGTIVAPDGNAVTEQIAIMLCEKPMPRFYTSVPCSTPLAFGTNTDGTFRIDSVPTGVYYITYDLDGWVGWSEPIVVGEGETVDVGRLSRK